MARLASYIVLLLIAIAVIAGVLDLGASLPAPPIGPLDSTAQALATTRVGLRTPLSQLLLQLLVVIGVCRAIGALFQRIGLTAVVGEMAAGIVLGPSLLGRMAPTAFELVFPSGSLGALSLLSQLGICIYMFKVGLDLNLRFLRGNARSALVVSHASIVAPFVLGVVLAYFLFSGLAGPRATFASFALFMGICMSITAFPVLARILEERGLTRTPLGQTAMTCAAIGDITAWIAMAFIVAAATSSALARAVPTLVLALLFLAGMILAVRPALGRWLARSDVEAREPSRATVAVVSCVVLAAGFSAEAIGIHALFGAFLAGAVMPESETLRRSLGTGIEKLGFVLLPLFFAFTGLRTEIDLLGDATGWLVCLLIVAVAVAGKLGASSIAARLTGATWRDALQLGALMNARGLMELIALNIGYDLEILSARVFTMLVIMALVTTLLTGPLLMLFGGGRLAAGR